MIQKSFSFQIEAKKEDVCIRGNDKRDSQRMRMLTERDEESRQDRRGTYLPKYIGVQVWGKKLGGKINRHKTNCALGL